MYLQRRYHFNPHAWRQIDMTSSVLPLKFEWHDFSMAQEIMSIVLSTKRRNQVDISRKKRYIKIGTTRCIIHKCFFKVSFSYSHWQYLPTYVSHQFCMRNLLSIGSMNLLLLQQSRMPSYINTFVLSFQQAGLLIQTCFFG